MKLHLNKKENKEEKQGEDEKKQREAKIKNRTLFFLRHFTVIKTLSSFVFIIDSFVFPCVHYITGSTGCETGKCVI